MMGRVGLLCMTALWLFIMFSPAFSAERPKKITVSAAISLKNVFEEIGKYYESRNKGAKVVFNFGASGDLMRQIEGGAPVDVFASAAQKDMDALEKKGLIAPASRADFAANSVVLIVPLNVKTLIKSFEELKKEGIKKIAVGNPKTVPAGRYAEEVLANFKILDAVRDKLILTENVRQALDYVARAEVDAGIVYSTDAMTRMKEVRIVAAAPERSHKAAVYPIAIVKGTKNEVTAKAFISLVTSAEGKMILSTYGFKAGQ
ncbi:MAG: molybdate ABC transporter substrate-binding protein [Nitrospiraceae bacterium]|nr:molybdate ABC transporter substrate-binding protein [Nitrospiraceae bacterium]